MTKPEFMESLTRRSASSVVCHIVTGTVFEIAPDEASFTCHVTSIRGVQRGEGPVKPDAMRVYLAEGRLRRVGEDWLLSHYDPGNPRIELLGPGIAPMKHH